MKDKGTDAEDLPLTIGAGYFANELDAKEYFATVPPTKSEVSIYQQRKNAGFRSNRFHRQISNCNKFGAMGYSGHWGVVSGLIGLSCARHMFVLPGGGVDLKLGET